MISNVVLYQNSPRARIHSNQIGNVENQAVLLACTVHLEYHSHFNCALQSIKHFILMIECQFSDNNCAVVKVEKIPVVQLRLNLGGCVVFS